VEVQKEKIFSIYHTHIIQTIVVKEGRFTMVEYYVEIHK